MTSETAKLGEADYFYDPTNWDCSYAADTLIELAEEIGDGEFMRVGRLQTLPDRWLARVVTESDEDGDAVAFDLRRFDTEEAARQAVATPGETP